MHPHIFLFICAHFLSTTQYVTGEVDESQWIDPHEMTSGQYADYISPNDMDASSFHSEYISSKSIQSEFSNNPNSENNCDLFEAQSRAYLKRTIKMILNLVHEEPFNDDYYKGELIFDIDSENMSKLQEFIDDKNNNLPKVDSILSEMLKKPTSTHLKEHLFSWMYKGLGFIPSRTGIITICVLAYLIVVYKMMVGHFCLRYILKFLIINFFLIDFTFVWIRLYQEAEINQMADRAKYKDAPSYCNPSKMTTMQILNSVIGGTDYCREYHHVTLTDIFWTVSVGDVLTEMVIKPVTKITSSMGPALGSFVSGIFGSLPWGVNIVLLPIVLVFTLIMICIILSFILQVPIKFNFFHLISFSFGTPGQPTFGNMLTGGTVDRFLDTIRGATSPRRLSNLLGDVNGTIDRTARSSELPRKMITDVENDDAETSNKEIKGKTAEGNKNVSPNDSENDDKPSESETELFKSNNTTTHGNKEEKEEIIKKRKRDDGAGDI